MADIFISYASEDRQRAGALAETLGAHGWSVWWDREIPLGQSFDQVIEKALASAKCVIVLWSSVSIASEWVRNEASEAKRRAILIPVFIERVDAPLAFRLLNGADLRDWSGDGSDAEFVRLVERVTELLAPYRRRLRRAGASVVCTALANLRRDREEAPAYAVNCCGCGDCRRWRRHCRIFTERRSS